MYTPHITHSATIIPNNPFFHTKNFTARNKQGNVIKSPTEVIKGAVTLSGSHPREKLWNATRRVTTNINTLEINPPITDTTTKSTTEIDVNPHKNAVTRDSTPRKNDTINVKNMEAAIFPEITGDLSKCDISPMCNAVLILEPKHAKIFPLIPMAGGTMITNPGSNANISEKDPK
jgi:hypothetical protein